MSSMWECAERAGWETLLEMETLGSWEGVRLPLEPLLSWWTYRRPFEKDQLSVVWEWAMYFDVPQRVPRVLCGHFAHERRVMLENNVSEPMVCSHGDLAGIKMVGENADDMKLSLKRISMDLPERTRKFCELLKAEMRRVHLELSVTEGDEEF